MVGEATVKIGRWGAERGAVMAFPRDREFGAAMGQRRWLKATTPELFRPVGFLAWGVSDPPPRPATGETMPPPAFSWCHRFTIGGRDQLVMNGGFGLHYFRIPRTFEQLVATLNAECPIDDSFFGVLDAGADIRSLLLIPAHCELDFRTASKGDELAIEVSGPVDRVVAWGKAML